MHTLPYNRNRIALISDMLDMPGRYWIAFAVIIGMFFMLGLDIQLRPVSSSDEFAMLQQLARDNNDGAQLQLGLAYRDGRLGLSANADKADYWLGKAAANGNDYARQLLGKQTEASGAAGFIQQFSRVLADRSLDRLQAKARQGDALAQFELAIRYRDGLYGVEQDLLQSQLWLKRAAAGGNEVARWMLQKSQP